MVIAKGWSGVTLGKPGTGGAGGGAWFKSITQPLTKEQMKANGVVVAIWAYTKPGEDPTTS